MGSTRRQQVFLLGLAALLTAGAALAGERAEFPPYQLEHWAWKQPSRPPVPAVRNRAWVASPIDAFILAKLEEKGLRPAHFASRETLIRRVAFDMTGLPPTPEEADAFLADRTPDAYARMVERYLASPAYGERWARAWLDLARYADTNGYEHDEVRPDAWRYRDYVVRSFNEDKPYDRFIREQLAGDEIAPGDPDALIATGFNLLGPDMTDAADQAARRQNTLNDMTDTAGLVFLGLTVGCARCHDHKYEPIYQKDYYRLQAFFAPAQFRKDLPVAGPEERARHEREVAAHRERLRPLADERARLGGAEYERLRTKRIAALPEDLQAAFRTEPEARNAEQRLLVEKHGPSVEPPLKEVLDALPPQRRARYEKVAAEVKALAAKDPRLPTAMALSGGDGEAPRTYLLHRGEPANRGEEVSPGFLSILERSEALPVQTKGAQGRRAALATWITAPNHPLTARVMVNRVWARHFGRGIVPSPSDLGVRGESPTHPELLDWLAVRFAGGEAKGERREVTAPGLSPHPPLLSSPAKPWSVKALHRLILNSNAYKQAANAAPNPKSKIQNPKSEDPDNELFSRMNRRRLEAEMVRDGILAVSGRLNRRIGGPGVFPPLPADALPRGAAWPVSKDPEDHTRRSLYMFVRRNLAFPLFEVFDTPDTNGSCARREASVTAPQALMLMNDPGMREHAQHFAGRVLAGAAGEEERIILAYRLALGRRPTPVELRLGREFLARQAETLRRGPAEVPNLPHAAPAGLDAPMAEAWTDYCLALFNLNEFVYVD